MGFAKAFLRDFSPSFRWHARGMLQPPTLFLLRSFLPVRLESSAIQDSFSSVPTVRNEKANLLLSVPFFCLERVLVLQHAKVILWSKKLQRLRGQSRDFLCIADADTSTTCNVPKSQL